MTTFKLLGNEDAVTSSLGVIPQGIGFPLHPVESTVDAGVSVRTVSALSSASFVDQDPSGIGVAMRMAFGAPQTTDTWSIAADGTATCLVADDYLIRLKISIGRTDSQDVSKIFVRALINGVQLTHSTHVIIDTKRIEIPQIYTGISPLEVGDVLTFEVVRDPDGANSGGLRAGITTVVGWENSPSASLEISNTFGDIN